MRQLIFQVPRGQGRRVLETAKRMGGVNLIQLNAQDDERAQDVVVVHVPNHCVEALVGDLEGDVPGLCVSFSASGYLALYPPEDETPAKVTHVAHRSPLEVYLSGLQSIGTWRGLLGYAAAAGVVTWIGLFTNTVFLLVAGMLIAPYAGPAMNAAIATARGDRHLLVRTVARFFAALFLSALVAGLLTVLARQRVATDLTVDVTNISSAVALLPLTAGAAGALNLVQSERNSLVSGAAVGILVAASLAPPTAIIGIAAALGEWPMVKSAIFLVVLQLVGINLAASTVFRLYGLDTHGVRYPHGRPWVRQASVGLTILALALLLTWQFTDAPELQRSTIAERAAADVRDVVEQSGIARLVQTNVEFTRADVSGQNTLLVQVHVQADAAAGRTQEQIRQSLTDQIQQRILSKPYGATPLVDVTVLQPPRAS